MKLRNRLITSMILLSAGWRAAAGPLAQEPITLQDFKLTGDLGGESASFTLTAIARVENPHGGTLDLLSGPVALTDIAPNPKVHLRVSQDHYILAFDHKGEFPIRLKF